MAFPGEKCSCHLVSWKRVHFNQKSIFAFLHQIIMVLTQYHLCDTLHYCPGASFTPPACLVSTPYKFLHLSPCQTKPQNTTLTKFFTCFMQGCTPSGHPGILIPPTITPAKLGCTPLTLNRTPGGRGAHRVVFGPRSGQ